MKDKKIIFMGTPDFAVPILKELINNTNVILVVTQPDKVVGRKKILTSSPIKKLALDNNIKVFQPPKIKIDYDKILALQPDLVVTCAYGQIIPKTLLDLPKYGAINVHASLLPKYRGGAPIHHALMNGEVKTGITIMYMDETMDTGDIISKVECPILKEDNLGSLHDKLSDMGSKLLIDTLPLIFSNSNNKIKQNNEEATYAPVIKRDDEKINFNRNGENIINQIRGLNPFPLAYFIFANNEIKVIDATFKKTSDSFLCNTVVTIDKNNLEIKCLDGVISLLKIKPNGKQVMNIKDYLNGLDKEKVLKIGKVE